MKIKGLNKVFYLKKELENIRKEINELEKDECICTKIVSKKKILINLYSDKMDRLLNEIGNIENYIDTIKSTETRNVFRKRFVDNLPWTVIGEDLNMSRTTAYRIVNKQLHNDNYKRVK